MKPIATEWSVYSETGVPAWVAASLFVVLLAVLLRWLHHECRQRRSRLASLLPCTLLLALVPAVAILWRPVVTRVQTFRHPVKRVAVIDGSQSMTTPLAAAGLARRLDLVAAWDGRPMEGRSLAMRAVSEALARFAATAREAAASLDRATAEAEQGLPPGADAEAASAMRATFLQELRGSLGGLVAGVQAAVAGASDAEAFRAIVEPLAAVEAAAAPLVAPQADPSGVDPAVIAARLVAFSAAADRLVPLLDNAQDTIDEAFVKTPVAAAIADRLAAADGRTRRDLANLAAASLPDDVTVVTAADGEPATDLYKMVSQAIDAGDATSDVVLLSDGAHNGDEDDGVLGRLEARGVRLTTVPTGISGPAAVDGAVVDWRLPRVLVAGKQAVLRAVIKAPAGVACRLAVRVDGASDPLGAVSCTTNTDNRGIVALPFKPPPEGRRLLRMVLDCPGDMILANNAAVIAVDVVPRSKPLLSIDDVPSWDGVWLALAAERQGIDVTQVHVAGTEPKRGGLSRSVPQSVMQWTRYRGVILDGPGFPGFSAEDAAALATFVGEKGGTLLLLAGAADGYAAALGRVFSFEPAAAEPLSTEGVRIAAAAAEEPSLQLASDGAHAARMFAALPPARVAYRVPRGDRVLLETTDGVPVCSLSFHGRGKLIHWGLRGMERMREFAGAAVVDRLLEGLIGEVAAPLFAEPGDETVAFHPPLPRIGAECLLITADGPQPRRTVRATAASTPIEVDGRTVTLVAHDNPGIETSLADFDEAFLRRMAADAKGRLVPPDRLAATLAAEDPRTSTTQTSDSWPIGRSPAIVAWLVAAAAAHWVLRKLAGLSI
ncbi:MAG: hypothetical protein ACKO6B_07545 [Planctomycetia bacterium]